MKLLRVVMVRTILGALVTALLVACAGQPADQYWVTSNRLNRRTCPSTDCGIVGQLLFREKVNVFEHKDKDGWVRISRYYDASCTNGRSEYIDRGDNRCDPENGIVNGKFSEWVAADFLSKDRPPDPAANAATVEERPPDPAANAATVEERPPDPAEALILIYGSDDFLKYRTAFAQAAQSLISSGQCREADFREWGGWIKSIANYPDQPIYFTYCGGSTLFDRLYLNAETGEVWH